MPAPIVKRYFLAVDRYKWLIPAGLALGITGGSLATAIPDPAPIYTVEAVLMGNRPTTVFSATGNEVRQTVETFTPDTLLSDDIIANTAKEVGLDPRVMMRTLKVGLPTAGAGAAGKEKKAAAAPGTERIKIEYKDTDSSRAKQVVERLSQRAVERSKGSNGARLTEVMKSLNERLPKVKAELTAAEQNLEVYDRAEGPALVAAQNGSLSGAIAQGESQVRALQMQIEGMNAEIGSLQEKLGLDASQAYVSSALSADPIIANLRSQIYQLESQLAIASKDLRPEHPTVIQLSTQIKAYEEQLRKRGGEVMQGGGGAAPFPSSSANIRSNSSLDPERQRLALRLVELTTQRDSLIRQLAIVGKSGESLREQLQNLPNKQLARVRLEDQLRLKKTLYDQMQAKLVDAKTAEAETVSSLSIAQLAAVPLEPKPPKTPLLLIIGGGIVGLILGAGIVFLLDTLEGTVYTPEDLREALKGQDVAVLGMLPNMPLQDLHQSIPLLIHGELLYSDAYERLRSNLRLSEGKLPRMVLVTSAIALEGKSTVAYNLAIAAARSGKRTLIIEADLRSPSQGRSIGVAIDTDQQIEPLRYYAQAADCIQLVPNIQNLYLIPSPGIQRQAASILESNEFRRVLDDVRGRFDFIVLDSPSLSQCNDALTLEPQTDGLILVTRPAVTQQSLVTEAIDQLNESETIRFLGAVVNGIDIEIPKWLTPNEEAPASSNRSANTVEATFISTEA
jgi:capsular exopolysaccharide synthesis family protein